MPRRERLVDDAQRLLVGDIVVQGVEQTDSLQVGHAVEMDDGLAVVAADGQFVLQAADHICHFGELSEVLQLPEHVDRLLHHLIVVLRHRHVHDGIVAVGIAVILVVIHLDGGIVPKFVGAHHLDVALHGANGNALGDTLHIIEGIGTGVHQVFERPPAVAVAKTVVNGLVAYQRILVGWHSGILLSKQLIDYHISVHDERQHVPVDITVLIISRYESAIIYDQNLCIWKG